VRQRAPFGTVSEVGHVSTTTDGSRSAKRGVRLERGKEKALRSMRTGCRRPAPTDKAYPEQDARERKKRNGEREGRGGEGDRIRYSALSNLC